MSLVREYRAADFDAVVPEAEALPLRIIRQAVHAYRSAQSRATSARSTAEATPDDARVARCVSHRDRLVRATRGQLVGAAVAWTGQKRGRLYIVDREERDGFLRVAWGGGRPPTVREVGRSDPDCPKSPDEILDLSERELLLALRAVDEVVQDRDQRVLIHRLMAADWDDEERHRIAHGWTIGNILQPAAFVAEHRLRTKV